MSDTSYNCRYCGLEITAAILNGHLCEDSAWMQHSEDMNKRIAKLQEKCDFVKSEYEKQKRESVKLQGQIAEVKKERIDYPRDIFNELIGGNSPYAFYLFQWVPYQTDARKWRLKMMHDVKTFDGREECGIWPNADSCGSFKDHEVEFIRISKDQGWHAWTDPRGGE